MEHAADGQTRLSQKTEEATQRVNRAREEQRRVNGLLVNSEGIVVEGLAKWRVAAGQYLDAQGEIVDKYGRSIRGLTVLQQKMKMYRNEQGKVRDANGEVVNGLGTLDQKLSDVDKALGLMYDEEGRLIKKVWEATENGVVIARQYYDELTDAQKKAGLYADELGRIWQDTDRGAKNLRQYTASAQAAIRDSRDFQMQLIESQSVMAGFLDNSEHNILRYLAAFQKILGTVGHDLLTRAGATASIKELWENWKDSAADLGRMGRNYIKLWKQVGASGDAAISGWGARFKAAGKALDGAKPLIMGFLNLLITIGSVALPEAIRLFKMLGNVIEEH